ncbi:MAG TPA: cytochrome c3 family protein, partial [Blastocatellia bacterium]
MPGIKKSILVCFLLAGVYLGAARSHALTSEIASGEAASFQGARASFPHDGKKHRELSCSECHSVSRAQPDVRDFPGHKACINCHNFAEMVFTKPIFCTICHNGRPVSKTQPALFGFPKPGVPTDFGMGFSHV